MLRVEALSVQSEIVALHTGARQRVNALRMLSDTVPNIPPSQPWYRNINALASPNRAMPFTPIVAAPSADGGGAIGELAIVGNAIARSGSATTEFRAAAWAADASGVIMANGLLGAVWTHNMTTQNRITMVYGDGSGDVGDIWVVRGSNADTIYNTGSYTGTLHLLTIRGVNTHSVSQTTLIVDGAGQLIPADISTMPLLMANTASGGYLGDLYAVRDTTGWRVHRSGSANISCRIAIVTLI